MKQANYQLPSGFAVNETKAPWHCRVVGILYLLWSAWAILGFVMTSVQNSIFLSRFPPEMMTMLQALPGWALAARACAIFASLIGAILLLKRSRHAYSAFVVLLSGLAIGTVGEEVIGLPASMASGLMLGVKFSNWAVAIGMICYAHWMRVTDVLR